LLPLPVKIRFYIPRDFIHVQKAAQELIHLCGIFIQVLVIEVKHRKVGLLSEPGAHFYRFALGTSRSGGITFRHLFHPLKYILAQRMIIICHVDIIG
jgi:hypothetical protein